MKRSILPAAITIIALLACISMYYICGQDGAELVALMTDSSAESVTAAKLIGDALGEHGISLSAGANAAKLSLRLTITPDDLKFGEYYISCKNGELIVRAHDRAAMDAAARYISNKLSASPAVVFARDLEYRAVAEGYENFSFLPAPTFSASFTADADEQTLCFVDVSREDFINYIRAAESGDVKVTASGNLGSSVFYLLEYENFCAYAAYYSGIAQATINILEGPPRNIEIFDAEIDSAPLITVISDSAIVVRLRDGSFLICGEESSKAIAAIVLEQSPWENEAIIALWLTPNEAPSLSGNISVLYALSPSCHGIPMQFNGGSVICTDDGIYEITLDGFGKYLWISGDGEQIKKYGELPSYTAIIAREKTDLQAEAYVYTCLGETGKNVFYSRKQTIVLTLPICAGSAYTILPK